MVPNLSKGAGIKGTALYVLHDVRSEDERAIGAALTPEHQTQHRVGMTATRNLSTDDPELAWRLMCATAKSQAALKQAAGVRACGRPSKYQCGHIALSWEQQTRPDAAEIERAADGALKALGWEHLQALIVEHCDHDHAHCHIVVNLVCPETGRNAPNTKNEYERLQRWAHAYDKARGLEVCPNRTARMERAPADPPPPAPAARWLSRKEYEAIRDAERVENRAQALGRYREAAAGVREQFRPEWAGLYQEQRAELRALDQEQRATLRQLGQAARVRANRVQDAGERGWIGPAVTVRNRMAEFVNAHRETIWRGIDETNQPGDQRTMLSPAFVRRALERAHAGDQAALLERHGEAKAALQGRHTEARQEAYRQAWQRPEPAQVVPAGSQPEAGPSKLDVAKPRAGLGLAATLAASAAGIAAYALSRAGKSEGGRDPERELAAAAERIDRHSRRAANANRRPQPEEPAKAQPPTAATDDLTARRQRAMQLREQHRQAAMRELGPERSRHRD